MESPLFTAVLYFPLAIDLKTKNRTTSAIDKTWPTAKINKMVPVTQIITYDRQFVHIVHKELYKFLAEFLVNLLSNEV